MSRPAPGAPGEAGAQISFDDNTLLPLLFGDHDRHLVRIEHALGVVLRSRGNEVAISGPPSSVVATEEVLRTLYDKLKQGLPMGGGEVEGAIRMAMGPGSGGAVGTVGGRAEPEPALTLRTRKRPVSPRSPRQADYVRAMQNNDLVLGLGPAGTGKTYLAVAMAVSLYLAGRVERIVLSRPAGGSWRASRLPARRPEGQGRPVPPPALRRALRHAAGGPGGAAHGFGGDRDRPARLHARAHALPVLHHPGRGAEHDRRCR